MSSSQGSPPVTPSADPPDKPSVYRLPQRCSPDRRRAREATLNLQRGRYAFIEDPPVEHEGQALTLPPRLDKLPAEAAFSADKKARLLAGKLRTKTNARIVQLGHPFGAMVSAEAWARSLPLLPKPGGLLRRWRADATFAAARLTGANPMQIEAWHPRPTEDDSLIRAVSAVLRAGDHPSIEDLGAQGRLLCCDYSLAAHPLIQRGVRPGLQVAAPLCIFYTDAKGVLHPAAIRLGGPLAEVVSPLGAPARWLYARTLAEVADGLYHEAVHHLGRTHLVSEVFAIATARQLHPDHPIAQLLAPHLRYTMAIDDLARKDLLATGQAIDTAVGAGVEGVLNLVRLDWKSWELGALNPRVDLQRRGILDQPIDGFHYRDDALSLWGAIEDYATAMVQVWYSDDDAILADVELRAWAQELSVGGQLKDMPSPIRDRRGLAAILAEVIYRGSAGHAAVNNGQFDKYGWVPHSPGAARTLDPDPGPDMTEEQFWRCMPPQKRGLAQLSMAWVLSMPTELSLVHAGEMPAFDAELNPAASRVVGVFRRRLKALSADIRARNDQEQSRGRQPYVYLDPYNVSASIET